MAIEERECVELIVCFSFGLALSPLDNQLFFRECPKAKEYDSYALVIDVQWANQQFFFTDVVHLLH